MFSSHSPRPFFPFPLCPLFCRQNCRCSRGGLETVAWQRLEKLSDALCLRCSSGLRGEISPAIPLTSGGWTIEIVLPSLTEQHIGFLTKIRSVVKTPRRRQQQNNTEILFFDMSLLSYLSGISSLATNFSRV